MDSLSLENSNLENSSLESSSLESSSLESSSLEIEKLKSEIENNDLQIEQKINKSCQIFSDKIKQCLGKIKSINEKKEEEKRLHRSLLLADFSLFVKLDKFDREIHFYRRKINHLRFCMSTDIYNLNMHDKEIKSNEAKKIKLKELEFKINANTWFEKLREIFVENGNIDFENYSYPVKNREVSEVLKTPFNQKIHNHMKEAWIFRASCEDLFKIPFNNYFIPQGVKFFFTKSNDETIDYIMNIMIV